MVDITTTIIHVTYVLHISVRPSFINNIANKRRSANKVNTQKCTCHVVSFCKGIQNTSSSTIFTWLKDRGFPISPSSYDLFDFIWIFLSSLIKISFCTEEIVVPQAILALMQGPFVTEWVSNNSFMIRCRNFYIQAFHWCVVQWKEARNGLNCLAVEFIRLSPENYTRELMEFIIQHINLLMSVHLIGNKNKAGLFWCSSNDIEYACFISLNIYTFFFIKKNSFPLKNHLKTQTWFHSGDMLSLIFF